MPKWFGWVLLVLSLVFGLAGGFFAAKHSDVIYWIGWGLGLGCLAVYMWKYDREEEPVAATTFAPPVADVQDEFSVDDTSENATMDTEENHA